MNNITTDDVLPMPSAALSWAGVSADAPIYDLRASVRVSQAAASSFNLTDYPYAVWGVTPSPIIGLDIGGVAPPLPTSGAGFYSVNFTVLAGEKEAGACKQRAHSRTDPNPSPLKAKPRLDFLSPVCPSPSPSAA